MDLHEAYEEVESGRGSHYTPRPVAGLLPASTAPIALTHDDEAARLTARFLGQPPCTRTLSRLPQDATRDKTVIVVDEAEGENGMTRPVRLKVAWQGSHLGAVERS